MYIVDPRPNPSILNMVSLLLPGVIPRHRARRKSDVAPKQKHMESIPREKIPLRSRPEDKIIQNQSVFVYESLEKNVAYLFHKMPSKR